MSLLFFRWFVWMETILIEESYIKNIILFKEANKRVIVVVAVIYIKK